ncbi:MAG TPA: caspase family protein [Leptolyngbyaceae cyanobacterium]
MARYALVIGISEYQSSNLSHLPKSINDAAEVARLLEEYGDFDVVKRLPIRWNAQQNNFEFATKMTGEELGLELRNFLIEQAANNEALIYFSGHGFTVYDNLGKQKGFLAASDCQITESRNRVSEQQRGISLDSLNDLIRESQLSSLVLILDCCRSGYFLERQLIEQTLTAFSSQRDYYLITACRGYEDSLTLNLPTEEYSVFTGALVEGLSLKNVGRNRHISGDRLFDYISTELDIRSNQLKLTLPEPIRMGWGRSIKLVEYPLSDTLPEEEVTFNSENPYRGLCPFEFEQEKYFCGRELAVRALMERLSTCRFLAVIGRSGSGKSSLVKAGLLPHLKRDRLPSSSHWDIETFTPGKFPLGKLVEILDRRKQLSQPFVLFIDQFEEVFTLCDNEAERQAFMEAMAEEASASERLTRVIVAIRGDFLDRCAAYPEAAKLINRTQPTTYVVPPLSYEGLEEAIEIPAQLHGVKFEEGLVSQIADDVDDQPGALPLLQYALKELWQVCIEKSESSERLLTKKGYEQIGGVKGALEKRANLVYQGFVEDNRAFVRQLFTELVQLGEGKEVTRRRVHWERLEAIANSIDQLRRVVEKLANERLIVTDENNVEVAHEALLSEWSLLRNWIEEDRENIRLGRRLEAYCREWQETYQKSDEALLTGARLVAIAEWVEKTHPRLPVEEEDFLQKSLEKRNKEIQWELEQERKLREMAEARAIAEAEKAEQERVAALAKIETALEAEARAKAEAREAEAKTKVQKQRTKFVGAVGTLAALSFGLILLATILEGEKKQREAIAVGALVTRSQESLKDGNQLEAAIASIQALNELKEIGRPNIDTLTQIKAVFDWVKERNRLEGHTLSVSTASFSPKEPLIASGSSDTTVKLWTPSGIQLNTPTPMKHDKAVWSVNFSPNGNYIASGSADKTVKLWKKNGSLITTLKGHEEDVNYVSFSPDNQIVASASSDRTVILWQIDVNSPQKLIKKTILKGHTGRIWSVEFSPDGKLIASASDDGTIKIWNKEGGALIANLTGHTASVRSASFGSSSKMLVSVSEDSTIRIWTWKENPKNWAVKTLTNQSNRSYLVKFSPNYKLITATSADGTIKFWDAESKKELPSIGRHRDIVYDINFRSDSQQIVTASRDKTVRIWSLVFDNDKNLKLNVDNLLKQGCHKLSDYLENNSKAQTEHRDVKKICNKYKS